MNVCLCQEDEYGLLVKSSYQEHTKVVRRFDFKFQQEEVVSTKMFRPSLELNGPDHDI